MQPEPFVHRKVQPHRLHYLPRQHLYRAASYLDENDKARALNSVGIAYRPNQNQKREQLQRNRAARLQRLKREMEKKQAAPDISQLSMSEDTTGVSAAIEAAAAAAAAEAASASASASAAQDADMKDEKKSDDDDDDNKDEDKETADIKADDESEEDKKDDDEDNDEDSSSKDEEDATGGSGSSSTTTPGPTSKPFVSPPDPDTLLARLNTRRLYKRIKHYKSDAKFAAVQPYAKNKTVEDLAEEEWAALLARAKAMNTARMQKKQYVDPIPPVPSAHELLMFSPCPRPPAILASYPRSGNSLCRTLFERTTLRVTGSDMRGGLAKHDLVGEAAVSSQRVTFVKTHYPERRGNPPFKASKVVLLVRNPFDAIDSFWNLMMTNTHTNTVEFTDEQKVKAQKAWEEMALKELHVWKEFHIFWLEQDIPMLLIRYEDLIRHPDEVTSRIVRFVLDIKNMGSFFTERIDRCIREEQLEKLGSYKPRSGGIGKSLSKYTPEMLQRMSLDIMEVLARMGYPTELLVPDADLWQTMKPLDHYGVEWAASYPWPPKSVKKGEEWGDVPHMVINSGELVRGKEHETNWRAVKQSLGLVSGDSECTCYRCIAARKQTST